VQKRRCRVEKCGGGGDSGGEGNENDILCGLRMFGVQLIVCIDKMTVPGADLSPMTAIMSGLSNTPQRSVQTNKIGRSSCLINVSYAKMFVY
jgi:hypothetical protein